MKTAYCQSCGERTEPLLADDGIGAYEFWGATGVHHDWVVESSCCDAECFWDVECTDPVTVAEVREEIERERADALAD